MSKDEKSNPFSGEFDAERVFELGSINLPQIDINLVETFENMEEVRDHVHAAEYSVPQEDVVGPGGVPLRKEFPVSSQGRAFTEDQAPIPGKKKVYQNVLTRMDTIEGPLAVLRRCKESQTRVKVYTRNHKQIRGILTGFIVAFDKHWNIVLKECEEVFIKKLRNKTPSFGDVSNVLSVSDLSIKCDDFHQTDYPYSPLCVPRVKTQIPSHAWPNPLREENENKCIKSIASSSEKMTHDDNSIADLNSDSQDVKYLRQILQIAKSVEDKETEVKPKRRRRRRKEEIRYRKVNQILVRGEMVAMIVVCPDPVYTIPLIR